MKKSYLPWSMLLSGVVAMCMLVPGSINAAPTPAETPQTSASAKSATRQVTGKVTDGTTGEPLIGATVQVEGNKKAITVTDIDGNFTIPVTGNKAIILVSYIGYKPKKVPVEDLGYLDIQMSGEENSLEEVVVVGAGTQKKVSVTGAISSVSGHSLKMPASTLSSTLGGKIAGVITRQNSGEPGTGAEFYIRGISTFGGRTEPLILLDDVEISASDLNFIPPENIESFSVLKDASATAIYGARGANGVMIITTKGGDYNAKTQINASFENAFNFRDKFPEFVDGPTYMELYNEAKLTRNPKLAPEYSDIAIQRTREGVNPYLYPNVDWTSEIFRKMAMRQRANINVSGGGSKVKYYMSLELQHEDGLLNTKKMYSWNNNVQIYNYTFQNNISYKLTPTTTVSMNMNAQIRQNSQPNTQNNYYSATENIFRTMLTTTPIEFPVTFPDAEGVGHTRFGSRTVTGGTALPNPFAMMSSSYYQANQNTINTVIKINQDLGFLTKGLSLQAWVNFKNWSQQSFNRSITPYLYQVDPGDDIDPLAPINPYCLNPDAGSDFISESAISRNSDNTFEMQANANYTRRFGNHDVSAMLMYRMREYRNSVLPNRNQGFSGRVTYDYAHRYLFEFNFGYNGTERLAKKDRFGFFPAASIGWVVSNEKFFEPITPVMNHLKLRASYGLVGSDDLARPGGSYFLYLDKLQDGNLTFWQYATGPYSGAYTYNGGTGGGPVLVYQAIAGLGWEKSRKLDIGLEAMFFGSKLNLTLDYFYEHRYDIFMQRSSWPWSLGYGFAIPWANTGEMDNRGFEVSVKYNAPINRETYVSFEGNLTYTQNKMVNTDEPDYPYQWTTATGIPWNNGNRYSTMGYIAEGLFQSQEEIDNSPVQRVGGSIVMPGDIKYRDLNGDGVIDANDQTMISKFGTTPRLVYGFGATLNWRKFDFGFFFTGSGMRDIMINGVDPFQQGIGVGNKNILKWVAENRFNMEDPNFNAEYPRLGLLVEDISNNTVASTYWKRNGSFLRLRNIELGWTFPYGRVYVSGANLFTFSSFKLWDPELSSWMAYPMQKTVNVGVKFTL